jgi:hypothetical protein
LLNAEFSNPELAFDPENLQLMCGSCNTGKSKRDETIAVQPEALPSPRLGRSFPKRVRLIVS